MASLSDYIHQLLSKEQYSFSLESYRAYSSRTDTAIKFELARHVSKGEIFNLRKGFYLIMPPRYVTLGKLPIQLYVEQLFKSLEKPYYLGLYTASRFHGSAHQQVQQDFIITRPPKPSDIQKKNFSLRFFTVNSWEDSNIEFKQSDAGIFRISDPSLTAVDLIHFQSKLGGMGRIYSVIEELADQMTPVKLTSLLSWYPHKASLQRLGFLLEEVGADKALIEPLQEHLQHALYFPILLSPMGMQRAGATDNFWKVDINVPLESDL
jgi:predicted transcriptional regulator of viral defense system